MKKMTKGFLKVLALTLLIGGVTALTIPSASAELVCNKLGKGNQCEEYAIIASVCTKYSDKGICVSYEKKRYNCVGLHNGLCVTKAAFKPTPLTSEQCKAEVGKGYVTALKGNNYPCFAKSNDYWMGAVKACHDRGEKLPTKYDMEALINAYSNAAFASKYIYANHSYNLTNMQEKIGMIYGREFLNFSNYNEMLKFEYNNKKTGFEPKSKVYNYAGRNRATKVLAPAYAICVAPTGQE